MIPVLYTVKDLAKIFKKHPNTIYAWFEDGLFPHAFKVKDGWYAPEPDVLALTQAKCEIVPGVERPPTVGRASTGKKGFVSRWKS